MWQKNSAGLTAAAAIVCGWFLIVAMVGVGGNFPLNDDFWYAWTARHLAEEGKLQILPGVPQLLVWHAAWGAALVRLFGSSHVVLRCGTLVWGLIGLLAIANISRRLRWDLPRTLLLSACVGTSPWYLNLAFSYMTDIPHLALILLAIATQLSVVEGKQWRVAVVGGCLGLAALTRQLALMTVPAFVLFNLLDVRSEHPRAFWRMAIYRAALLGAPLLILYAPWHYWYAHINGTTPEYDERWSKLRQISYQPLFHFLAAWHYVGLWLFPIAAAFWSTSRAVLKSLLRPRLIAGGLVGLVGYAIAAPIAWHVDSPGRFGLDIHYPPTMPYLTNTVYLSGVGVPTIYETYFGKAPFPHDARWFGVVLTVASILGGVVALALLVPAIRQTIASSFTRSHRIDEPSVHHEPRSEPRERERIQRLLIFVAVCYFCGLCLVKYIFDRYLLVFLPFALLLAIDAAPKAIVSSKLGMSLVTLVAVFSIGSMHEYLAWNAARDQVVKDLLARGVPDSEIDGGYEINGPLRAVTHAALTGKVFGTGNDPWWGQNARYRIAFWPRSSAGCTPVTHRSYWTWPGTGEHAVYALDCANTSAEAATSFAPRLTLH